ITGLVDGGSGLATYVNTLDYSLYPSGVTVTLANAAAGTATATGGVLNIQNVNGTAYNDTLTGNDQPNVFLTHGGRDTISCLGGNDTVHIVGVQDPATTIDGGTGTNLLWANDGTNIWSLTGAGAGTLASSAFTNSSPMAFSHMQQVLGGQAADIFEI